MPLEDLDGFGQRPEDRVFPALVRQADRRHPYLHARPWRHLRAERLGQQLSAQADAQDRGPLLHRRPNEGHFRLDPLVRIVDRHGAAHHKQDISRIGRQTDLGHQVVGNHEPPADLIARSFPGMCLTGDQVMDGEEWLGHGLNGQPAQRGAPDQAGEVIRRMQPAE